MEQSRMRGSPALAVTVLGCDGSYPGPGGACSGYLVRYPGHRIWVDCGNGTLAALTERIALSDLTAIYVSHEHPDHRADLDAFLIARRCIPTQPTPLYGPPGLSNRLYHDFDGLVDIREVSDGQELELAPDWPGEAPLRLAFSRTDHGPPTFALAITSPAATLAYSADTGPRWSLASFNRPIDTALCEASYMTEMGRVPGHLSAEEAGAMAQAAGVKRLVLTHRWPNVPLDPWLAEARAKFLGPVSGAFPGATYYLNHHRKRGNDQT